MSCPGRACTRIRTSSSSVPWKTKTSCQTRHSELIVSHQTQVIVLEQDSLCIIIHLWAKRTHCEILNTTHLLLLWRWYQGYALSVCGGKTWDQLFWCFHGQNFVWNATLTSSDSRSSSVSSTWTTASAPQGIGAPVVTLITWPGITVWVGCMQGTHNGQNTGLKRNSNSTFG